MEHFKEVHVWSDLDEKHPCFPEVRGKDSQEYLDYLSLVEENSELKIRNSELKKQLSDLEKSLKGSKTFCENLLNSNRSVYVKLLSFLRDIRYPFTPEYFSEECPMSEKEYTVHDVLNHLFGYVRGLQCCPHCQTKYSPHDHPINCYFGCDCCGNVLCFRAIKNGVKLILCPIPVGKCKE